MRLRPLRILAAFDTVADQVDAGPEGPGGEMKFNVEVEATPQEMRAFLGLPDVAPLQKEMLDELARRMREGQQGYDALSLMQPMLQSGVAGMDAFQKLFWQAFSQQGERPSGRDKEG
ncbi:DUF6489 family protein [Ectothiorhodospira mobilis]|nr:DUF6489 family protein [Ectothiorhodospira mobilis]